MVIFQLTDQNFSFFCYLVYLSLACIFSFQPLPLDGFFTFLFNCLDGKLALVSDFIDFVEPFFGILLMLSLSLIVSLLPLA